MRIINTIQEMKSYIKEIKKEQKVIGLVPTMGYLHEGHLTLMREAKKQGDIVVISIFVNPLQFGVNEDFDDYPRNLDVDSQLAESVGVDIIFHPTIKEMYPTNYNTFVDVQKITETLCGASRPGHFKGVTTVVNKLFNIVQPDYAFFGQKDAQQVLVLKKMIADLNMNLEIKIVPIVREADGLALSSRNVFLSKEERQAALILNKSLNEARKTILSGERNYTVIKQLIEQLVATEPLVRVDYIALKSWPLLEDQEIIADQILIAMACFVGKTRLIDNVLVEV